MSRVRRGGVWYSFIAHYGVLWPTFEQNENMSRANGAVLVNRKLSRWVDVCEKYLSKKLYEPASHEHLLASMKLYFYIEWFAVDK